MRVFPLTQMDFMSDPLSNSLFHFIDCDVKNEVLRVIMDGGRIHRAKTQWQEEKRRVMGFACQRPRHWLKMVHFACAKGFTRGTGLFWLWYKCEHFLFTFEKAKNCGYIKYWGQREIICSAWVTCCLKKQMIFKSLHFWSLYLDAKTQHLWEGN